MDKKCLEDTDKCYNCGWLDGVTEDEDDEVNGEKFCDHLGDVCEVENGCDEFESL